jgi:membrane protease YdiL (CAAX protease family)
MGQSSSTAEVEKEAAALPVSAGPSKAVGPLQRFWQWQFAGPLYRVDQECRQFLASDASRRADRKVIIVLVTVAVCLTIQRYAPLGVWVSGAVRQAGSVGAAEALLPLSERLMHFAYTPLGRLFYWSLACILTYYAIPALVIHFLLRERLRDYGLKLQGAFAGFWIYAIMLAIMLPLVYLVSADDHFQMTYPFYPLGQSEPLWPNFWRWEVMYAFQFFTLEFFFRGFIVHGTRHRFGLYAVFVMMVPYCMIHFQKPVQEAFASILAGIVLGFMSLKTRSIWMGAVLHVSVALSMDFASLWRKGYFS